MNKQYHPRSGKRILTPRYRTRIEVSEIIALLQHLEHHNAEIQRHRKTIADHTATLHHWLACSDEFAAAWGEFTAAGGTTGDDFYAFVRGRWQSRPVEQHQHLRLIADNTIKRRRVGKKPPPNAA
jgi:hypothetical protein